MDATRTVHAFAAALLACGAPASEIGPGATEGSSGSETGRETTGATTVTSEEGETLHGPGTTTTTSSGSSGSSGEGPSATTGPPGDSPLGVFCAEQPGGTWVEYDAVDGLGPDLFLSTNAEAPRHTMAYASVAAFDAVNEEVLFTGKGYGGGTEYLFSVWNLQEDSWSIRARGSAPEIFASPGPEAFGHAYNGNAWDPSTEAYYFFAFQNSTVQRWDAAASAFVDAFVVPGDDYSQQTPVLVPFPEFGRAGGIFLHSKSSGAFVYDLAARIVVDLGTPWSENLHSVGYHNPVQETVLFGGGSDAENGSREYWVASTDGTLSSTHEFPVAIGVAQNDAVVYDAGNGDWLLANTDGDELFRSPDGVTWNPDPLGLPAAYPVVYATLPAPYTCLLAIDGGSDGGGDPEAHVYVTNLRR